MLTNYDAEAVAEVMGIAFVRGPEGRRSPAAAAAKAATSSKSRPAEMAGNFIIHIGDTPVLIVEAKTGNTRAPFKRSKGGADRRAGAGEELSCSASPVLIEKAVARGLPRNALRNVAEWLAGDDKAKISSLEWGVVPKTTLERREKQLSPRESERTERVARLFVHARRALGTEVEAREFMTTPHPQLDGRSPIEAARTDLGTRRTEQILNALEYGLAL